MSSTRAAETTIFKISSSIGIVGDVGWTVLGENEIVKDNWHLIALTIADYWHSWAAISLTLSQHNSYFHRFFCLLTLPSIRNVGFFEPHQYFRNIPLHWIGATIQKLYTYTFHLPVALLLGKGIVTNPKGPCYRAQLPFKFQQRCAFFNMAHPHPVPSIQLCHLDTSNRYGAVQMKEKHINQKLLCIISAGYWRRGAASAPVWHALDW